MGFVEAVLSGLRNYINFRGRASRSEFWWFFVFYLLVLILAAIVDQTLQLYLLAILVLVVPYLAVAIRRLHDTGHSGLWLFVGLIPLVGFIVLLVFFASAGDTAANKHGPPPGVDAGAVPALAPSAPPASTDPTEQIRKLSELKDSGAISQEEFEAKKAELLGRI